MKRVIAAALAMSVLAGLFVAAPALAGTYTTYGTCTWTEKGGSGMWMDYPEETFYTLADAQADLQAMAADCKSRRGTLSSTLTTVVAAKWTAYGTCTWRMKGVGAWIDYPARTFDTWAEADAYVQTTMVADCRPRHGKLTSSITEV